MSERQDPVEPNLRYIVFPRKNSYSTWAPLLRDCCKNRQSRYSSRGVEPSMPLKLLLGIVVLVRAEDGGMLPAVAHCSTRAIAIWAFLKHVIISSSPSFSMFFIHEYVLGDRLGPGHLSGKQAAGRPGLNLCASSGIVLSIVLKRAYKPYLQTAFAPTCAHSAAME